MVDDRLFSCILEILGLMVSSGAEIYRVEESAIKMFSPYRLKRVDVYATTSNIILSIETFDGKIQTCTRRITDISTNIEKVDKLNSLARCLSSEKMNIDEIENKISEIKEQKGYPKWLVVLFYGIIAGAFYFFFGGKNMTECVISIFSGLLTGVVYHFCAKFRIKKILCKFICSFCTCLIAFISLKVGMIQNIDPIIIGNIMTLIPGVGLTESLRDLLIGDSISGTLRFIEATLSAFAISGGYIAIALIFGDIL